MRFRTVTSLTMLLALLVTGCASTPTPPAQTGGAQAVQPAQAPARYKKLVAGIRGTPPVLLQKLNFGGTYNGTAHLEYLVHAGLLVTDTTGRLVPQLAEAAPTIENGLWKVEPDGRMETTWKLKPNLKWHDGVALTSDDLLFTAQAEQAQGLAWNTNIAYEAVERVEAPDPFTLTVYWKGPFVEADQLFTQTASAGRALPFPRHLLERAFNEDRANFVQNPYFGPEFVGAGPYKLKEWAQDAYLILVANDDYVLGRPKIDEIEVRFFGDNSTVIANLLAGEIQYTMDGRTLTFEDSLSTRDQWKTGHFELAVNNTITLFPQFLNGKPAVVGDLRFRRALMYGMNRQEMVDSIEGGLASVADSAFGPDLMEFPYLERQIVKYEYDPRKAQQLVEELGFTKGPDGGYRDATGERLSFQLHMGAAIINQKAGLAAADNWQRIGIGVDPVAIPQQRLVDREYMQSFPAFLILRSGRGNGDFMSRHSSRAPLPENQYSGLNRGHYMNPSFDAIADRYFVTIPFAERMDVLGQIVRHETEQLSVMRMFFDPEATAVGDKLKNVPAGNPWNAQDWDLE